MSLSFFLSELNNASNESHMFFVQASEVLENMAENSCKLWSWKGSCGLYGNENTHFSAVRVLQECIQDLTELEALLCYI